MAINDNDLLLINDSQDSNEAKKIKYSTLKSNINGDDGNNLQSVTDNGNTTTNGAEFGSDVTSATNVYAGGEPASGQAAGARLQSTGKIYAARAGAIFEGFVPGNSTANVLINGDGSAEFGSGNIELNAGGSIQSTVTAGINFEARKSTGGVIQLGNADGTASSQLGFSAEKSQLQVYPNLVAGFGPKIATDNDNIAIFGGTNNGANQIIIDNDGDILIGGTPLSSPNISLNATDGSAEFAGSATVDRSTGYAAFVTKVDGATTSVQMSDGDLRIGGNPNNVSQANIVLKPDGSAKFGSGNQFFDWRQGNGVCQISTSSGTATQALLYGQSQVGGSTLDAFKFTADGSASFAGGDISLNANGGADFSAAINVNRPDGATNDAFAVRNGAKKKVSIESDGDLQLSDDLLTQSTPNIYLKASDGSASFAGEVTFDGAWGVDAIAGRLGGGAGLSYVTSAADAAAVQIYSGGYDSATNRKFLLSSDGSAYFGGVIQPGLPANAPNITLNAGGSASFSGPIKSINGQSITLQADSGNSYLDSTGGIVFRTDGVTPVAAIYPSGGLFVGGGNSLVQADNSSGNIELNEDGSASFASYIESGSVAHKGGGGNVLNFGEVSTYSANATSFLWRGWDAFSGSANTLTSHIKADGSAHFAGNVTSDGTIGFTLPDGSTYDIRERIEEAITRVTAIETADLTDDQEHSALLTLIANMSSRITALEAQLAGGN